MCSVPDWYAMAPPNLSTDTPIAKIIYPMEVCFLEALRKNIDVAVIDYGLHNFFQTMLFALPVYGRLINVDEPL